VAQATHYQGTASTQFASLATTGFGFVSSLEAGYPIRLPLFGPGFVLDPQAQILWQRVSFGDANDGLGEVALGTTSVGSSCAADGPSPTTAGRYGSLTCAPIWCRCWSRPRACNWAMA
jgi:outer membrane autotransporter protein